ncbi:MAG: hypothetical protein Q9202_004723 [Teloschistes flavicans]
MNQLKRTAELKSNMATATAIIDLNWRNSKPQRDILEAIDRLFADADANPDVPMICSQTNAKNVIRLQLVNNVLMVTREDRTYKRNVLNQTEYWARLLDIGSTLYNMQVDGQSFSSRFIEYKDVDPELGETLPTVKRKVLDIALTTSNHPVALGVKYTESGRINIPEGSTIDVTVITNIFKFNNRYQPSRTISKECSQTIKLSAGDRVIPNQVYSLKVKIATGRRIDAVIVVEHRNVAGVITEHAYALKDVLVVMTGGFPSSATKEFLHMLCHDRNLEAVPFLYFGDHDMQGFTIYQTIKYGSKNSAWASPSMVCPNVIYVGPTKRDLLEMTDKFGMVWRDGYRTTNPEANDIALSNDFSIWKRTMDQKVKGKFVGHTQKDREVHKAFRKIGWLNHEPLAKHEVELIMSDQKAKFRLANLSVADTRYIRQFFEAKLQEQCRRRPRQQPEPPVVPSSSVPRGSEDLVSQLKRAAAQENTQTPAGDSPKIPADPPGESTEPNRIPMPESSRSSKMSSAHGYLYLFSGLSCGWIRSELTQPYVGEAASGVLPPPPNNNSASSSNNNSKKKRKRGEANAPKCERCGNKQHQGECWPVCEKCHDRHHPKAKECPRAKQKRRAEQGRAKTAAHPAAPATSPSTIPSLAGLVRGQNVFNLFGDSTANLQQILSAVNSGGYASTSIPAAPTKPASTPALNRVQSGRTEKEQRGPRGSSKAEEKKKKIDEMVEKRVKEEVEKRWKAEQDKRVREEMGTQLREEAALQEGANSPLPEEEDEDMEIDVDCVESESIAAASSEAPSAASIPPEPVTVSKKAIRVALPK